MSKPKNHIPDFGARLEAYAQLRGLDLHQYSMFHFRIMDGGFVVLDTWTTGRYFIVLTDYNTMTDDNIIERQGEKGQLPITSLSPFLDEIFYPSMNQGKIRSNYA